VGNIAEFHLRFPDDEACLAFLWRAAQSPDGETAYCARCSAYKRFRRYSLDRPRRSWTCTTCGNHVTPTTGTIFERSGTPLLTWFYAIYLISHQEGRVSARRLQRELGVTYKTAWRILHRVRERMSRPPGPAALFEAAPMAS
jgi:transposase-like protein